MTNEAAERTARQVVGTIFDNTSASPETLKRVMLERIVDWLKTRATGRQMTKAELLGFFNVDSIGSVLIEFQNERGIALKLGENLSEPWQSGDVIVFWAGGEHTVLPETFTLISFDVFNR